MLDKKIRVTVERMEDGKVVDKDILEGTAFIGSIWSYNISEVDDSTKDGFECEGGTIITGNTKPSILMAMAQELREKVLESILPDADTRLSELMGIISGLGERMRSARGPRASVHPAFAGKESDDECCGMPKPSNLDVTEPDGEK